MGAMLVSTTVNHYGLLASTAQLLTYAHLSCVPLCILAKLHAP